MKGDFTRDTFEPEKHFRQVLMQQGRVQLDADWNEQAAIAARRDETTTADLAGDCGGPAEGAAFAITPAPGGDFLLSSGRYYVDGIQCELEQPARFTRQPDRRGVAALPAGQHLIYLDVWRRHITQHEDADLRETALGGPDTGTRVGTVWQVRAAALNAPFNPNNPPPDPCHLPASDFEQRSRAVLPRLAARTKDPTPETDPCVLPSTAGYRGLENQLYRVEIHAPGGLNAATFKWSRENGAVATRITHSEVMAVSGVNVNRLTVASTGPDDHLGFAKGSLVEILHETEELEQTPGVVALVDDVNASTGKIILKGLPGNPMPVTVNLAANPRLRRWEGLEVATSNAGVNNGFLALESGIEVRFDLPAGAGFRTGDYWLIPARAASPDALSGRIEWPSSGGAPEPLPPKGIQHHFCRLGVVSVNNNGGVTVVSDCRCLWPALTAVPRLFYVSGDGQEVMPDLTAAAGTRFKLPRPLVVGVANGHCLDRATSVRFEVVNTAQSPSDGRVAPVGVAPTQPFVVVPLDADGLARCDFHLDGTRVTQQVMARLLDAAGHPVSLPLLFNANLSIASQVAYQPGDCAGLAGQRTVQDAIARLASMVSLHKVTGDGQQAAAGAKLREPLRVRVANRCGPVAGMTVSFQVVLGGGTVTPASSTTDANGEATCDWQLGDESILQVVASEVAGDATRPATEPRRAHFIAHLLGGEGNDAAPVRVVGLRFGKPTRVLVNGQTLAPADLEAGVMLLCDQAIDPGTVLDPIGTNAANGTFTRGQPTCCIAVEVPYPLTQAERSMWDLGAMAGYHSIILHGQANAVSIPDSQQPPGPPLPAGIRARGLISWQTGSGTITFLNRVLAFLGNTSPRPDKLLARLTLKGNFIWSEAAKKLFDRGTPGGFLDGETWRAPRGGGESELLLPTGDNRRGGDFEMWFWLAFNAPPVITRAPQNLTVNVGQSAGFNVEFQSSGAATFQWQKNGALIPGATAASITVSNAQLADDGSRYRVVVANEAGAVTSPEATLRVVPNVKTTDKVAEKTVEKGKDIKEGEVKVTDKALERHAVSPGAGDAPAPTPARKARKPKGRAFISPKERPPTAPRPKRPGR